MLNLLKNVMKDMGIVHIFGKRGRVKFYSERKDRKTCFKKIRIKKNEEVGQGFDDLVGLTP